MPRLARERRRYRSHGIGGILQRCQVRPQKLGPVAPSAAAVVAPDSLGHVQWVTTRLLDEEAEDKLRQSLEGDPVRPASGCKQPVAEPKERRERFATLP